MFAERRTVDQIRMKEARKGTQYMLIQKRIPET